MFINEQSSNMPDKTIDDSKHKTITIVDDSVVPMTPEEQALWDEEFYKDQE